MSKQLKHIIGNRKEILKQSQNKCLDNKLLILQLPQTLLSDKNSILFLECTNAVSFWACTYLYPSLQQNVCELIHIYCMLPYHHLCIAAHFFLRSSWVGFEPMTLSLLMAIEPCFVAIFSFNKIVGSNLPFSCFFHTCHIITLWDKNGTK